MVLSFPRNGNFRMEFALCLRLTARTASGGINQTVFLAPPFDLENPPPLGSAVAYFAKNGIGELPIVFPRLYRRNYDKMFLRGYTIATMRTQ